MALENTHWKRAPFASTDDAQTETQTFSPVWFLQPVWCDYSYFCLPTHLAGTPTACIETQVCCVIVEHLWRWKQWYTDCNKHLSRVQATDRLGSLSYPHSLILQDNLTCACLSGFTRPPDNLTCVSVCLAGWLSTGRRVEHGAVPSHHFIYENMGYIR